MFLLKQNLCLILIIFYINVMNSKILLPTNSHESIYKKLEDIINQCFWNNLNSIIMTEEVNQHLHYFNPNLKSTVLINENFSLHSDYQHYPKLITFILPANSIHQLNETLKVLNTTIWWDYDSNFILIKSGGLCNDVSTMLNVTWKWRLLSVILLCNKDQEDSAMIYTYNPFTNRAPNPWALAEYENKLVKPWTLYKRPYLEDKSVCVNLLYNKLKFMDGYKINCMVIPKPGAIYNPDLIYNTSTVFEKVVTKDANFLLTLMKAWNITANVHYNTTLYYMKRNYFHLILSPLFITTWDRFLVIPTYPGFDQISLVIITQKRPFLKPEEIILSFYSYEIVLLSITSFCIAIVALILNKKQRISSAVLDVFRLLVSCSIEQPLKKLPIRIFFFGIFWLATIINATFQGNLATFLTKPERVSIETLDDLTTYKYKIHMYPQYYNHFQESFSSVNKSLYTSIFLNGYEYVVNNSRAAYIVSSSRGYGPAFKYQLHVSKPFLSDYVSISVPKDFPFVDRINEISIRCFEAGLIKLWESEALYDYKKNLTITEAIETAVRFRPISFPDLSFAFKLFAISIGCSFLMFIKEINSYKSYNKKKKTRIRVRMAKKIHNTNLNARVY